MNWTVQKLQEKMDAGPCAIEGVPEDVYHALFAMSASGIKNMKKCPGYWKWRRENPSPDTSARRFGRLVHLALGEPERFKKEVVCVEGHRGGKAVKELVELHESQGKTVTKPDEYKLVQDIAQYCREDHEITPSVFKTGTGERTLLWRDAATGVPCKSRIDWVSGNGIIFDWKTFDEIQNEHNVGRQITKMDYHVQSVWYSRAYEMVYGKKPHSFNFVFIESEEGPKSNWVDLAIRDLDEKILEDGRMWVDHVLRTFEECIKTDVWPRTPPLVLTAQTRVYSEQS